MNSKTLRKAGEIWNYMSGIKSQVKSDAIVICCSYDLRVCDHACQLILEGTSDTLIISGRFGNWTKHVWNRPEAEVFYDRAIENGVNEKQILMETEATNFGENISYAKALIPQAKTVTFVSKPNSLLRVQLTAEVQWPGINVVVSCPDISFPTMVSNVIGIWGVIHEMVGDLERIQVYPELGFQAPHVLPEHIVRNWEYLIEQGFTCHLMPDKPMHPDAQSRAADARRHALQSV